MLKVLRFHKFPEARWFEFGLNLGLLHPTLEAIESAHRGNPSRCLMDCLAKWLNKADVTAGPVTWQALANAIRGLDIKSIANDIHKTSKAAQYALNIVSIISRVIVFGNLLKIFLSKLNAIQA